MSGESIAQFPHRPVPLLSGRRRTTGKYKRNLTLQVLVLKLNIIPLKFYTSSISTISDETSILTQTDLHFKPFSTVRNNDFI